MALARKAKPDPARLYICLDGYIFRDADGVDVSVKEGARLLGNSAAVKAHPELWMLEGTDDDDLHKAKQAILQRATGGAA